jgi:hypothetical protein
VELEFSGAVWEWRGPAPFFFVTVPDEQSRRLQAVSPGVTYGWGMVPVHARIGRTEWRTALWPKDGRYVVPLKAAVHRAEEVDDGDTITVALTVDDGRRR